MGEEESGEETSEETSSEESPEETSTEESSEESSESSKDEESSGIGNELDLSSKSTGEGSGEATAKEDGEEDAGTESKPPEGAPEEYEALTIPGAGDWNDEDSTRVFEVAKELGLTQEGAQKLANLLGTHGVERIVPMLLKQQGEAYAEHKKAELARAMKNPVLVGKNGDQWDTAKAYVREVVLNFGGNQKDDDGLNRFQRFEKKGFVDDEDFMVFMHEAGRALMPDTLDPTGDPGSDTSYEDLDPSRRMGWDKDGLPIGRTSADA